MMMGTMLLIIAIFISALFTGIMALYYWMTLGTYKGIGKDFSKASLVLFLILMLMWLPAIIIVYLYEIL